MATTCTPQALAAASACIDLSLPAGIVREAVKTYLLAVEAGGSTNAITLLAQARAAGWCADKIPPQDQKAAQVYMLALDQSTTLQPAITLSKCFDLEPSSSKSAGTIFLLADGNSVSTNPTTLVGLATTNKFLCGMDVSDMLSIQSMLIATITSNVATPQAILNSAACYSGIGSGLVAAIEEYLWCLFFSGVVPPFSPSNYIGVTLTGASSAAGNYMFSTTTGFYAVLNPDTTITTYTANSGTMSLQAGLSKIYSCVSLANSTESGSIINFQFLAAQLFSAIDFSHATGLATGVVANASLITSIPSFAGTGIQNLNWSYSNGLITADFTSGTNLTYITCRINPNLTSINVSGLVNLAGYHLLGNGNLQSINSSGCSALVAHEAGDSPLLTSLDFTGCTDLALIEMSSATSLVSFTFNDSPNLVELYAQYSGFSTAMLDYIAAELVANGLPNGNVNVAYCAGSPPSATGIADYAILSLNGWSITY